MNQDAAAVAAIMKGHPELAAGYASVREFLTDTGATLKQMGRFKTGITDYLPRVVKDYPGLMKSFGREAQTALQSILLKAESESVRLRGRMMTEVEKSLIIDRFIQSQPGMSSLPGFARDRTMKMTDAVRPFYHTMEDGLVHYAHAAMNDIAQARFFGQDLKTKTENGKTFSHIEYSIGEVVGRGMREGRMTPEQAVEASDILRSRFGAGAKAPAAILQDVRNLTGIALLTQIGSGVLQTADALMSVYHHGLRPALHSAGILLTRRGIQPSEFGLATHVIEEVIGNRLTGKVLSAGLKANLLAPLDQIGMRQNLTASYLKNKRLSATPRGIAELERKWGATYGTDFPALIRQLKESRVDKRRPLVESLLYAELSDVRPTSRSETPQMFLDHPNGRFLYQFSMFTLKQMDILRRDAYAKIKTGKPAEVARGLKNLAMYATALSLSLVPVDAIKAWLMGREFEWDDVSLVDNFFRNFGWSRWNTDRLTLSTNPALAVGEAVVSPLVPPAAGAAKWALESTERPEKLVKGVPVVGAMIYNRALGGNEEKEISKARRLNRDRRKELGLASGRPLSSGDKTRLSAEAEKFRKDRLQQRIDKREREARR